MADRGKPIPHFETDEALEHFADTADLSAYDLSAFKPMKFELSNKDARVNMRVPQRMLSAIKTAAAKEGIPYQRYMRDVLERALEARQGPKAVSKKKAS